MYALPYVAENHVTFKTNNNIYSVERIFVDGATSGAEYNIFGYQERGGHTYFTPYGGG